MKRETVVICAILISVSAAANVPTGFIPLPPLPKATSKPQPVPTTKKPTVTNPPFIPTTAKPKPPPSSRLPSSIAVPTSLPQPSQSSNCGLNVNVPGVQCNTGSSTNSLVQQALTTLQQELDKTRQQHQAQNSAVQSIISQLQTRQVAYISKISDLQNEVANLVTAFNTVCQRRPASTIAPVFSTVTPSLNGPSNALLQKAVQDVKNDVSSAVQNFNNRVFNLSAIMHANEQQELKINQGIESQIQQQAQEIGKLSQQVIDLTNQLSLLNTSPASGTGSGGASPADIAKLQAQVNKVASDIQLYDRSQQSQFNQLNLKAATLLADVNNHTNEIRNLRNSLFLDESRIRILDQNITVVHDALGNFRQQINPEMARIDGDVTTLKNDVTSQQTSVSRLDKSILNLIVKLGGDERTLQTIQGDSTQLKTDVGKLQGDINQQNTEIAAIKNGLVNLKNAIPISELNAMNNVILTALNNGTLTSQQLQNLTQAISTITTRLGQININFGSG